MPILRWCRYCFPDAFTRADPSVEFRYVVDVRPNGEPIMGAMHLCRRHAHRLDVVRNRVTMGLVSDWDGLVRHDLKQLDQPIIEH